MCEKAIHPWPINEILGGNARDSFSNTVIFRNFYLKKIGNEKFGYALKYPYFRIADSIVSIYVDLRSGVLVLIYFQHRVLD